MADSVRFSKIDDSNRGDHYFLVPNDTCYYLFEYTSGRNYTFSNTNNLISNLKKKPSKKLLQGYHHKERAIIECAGALRTSLNPAWLQSGTLVPIPCSKAAGDPDYDDRIERICRTIGQDIDVRTLVKQTTSMVASHEAPSGERVTVTQLLSAYEIDETLTSPVPTAIGVVDDVLTAGTHYRAMQTVLARRFPGVLIVGLFLARRIFPDETSAQE